MTQEHGPEDWKARALEAEREAAQWKAELWECYLMSGADPDGDDGSHLNPGETLYEVTELRETYDECPTPEDLKAAEARAESAEARLERVREWAEGVKDRPWDRDPIYGGRDSYNGGLTAAAQIVRRELSDSSGGGSQ